MIRRSGAVALLTLPLALAAQPAAAKNTPITVNVRVEGIHKTLFEGNVRTTAHKVNGHDGTGKHRCDGTNNARYKNPGPTAMDAFDAAMRLSQIPWLGSWNSQYQEFFVERIGPDKGTYWDFAVKWHELSTGGCEARIHNREHVLVAWNGFGEPLLKLRGPKRAQAGKPFTVEVRNGRTGDPVGGAKVDGHKTNSKGKATLMLGEGLARLKAHKKGTVRSNELDVVVHP